MELTNPAVTQGVDIFINIVVVLIAFGHALAFVNARKEKQKKGSTWSLSCLLTLLFGSTQTQAIAETKSTIISNNIPIIQVVNCL